MGTPPARSRLALLALTTALALLSPVCKKPSRAPDTPTTPFGVTAGCFKVSYEFASAASDPDSESVALRFAWGDGDTSDWSTWVAGGDTATIPHEWNSAGTYQVVAQAVDARGVLSAWSSPAQVSIVAVAPGSVKNVQYIGYGAMSSPAIGPDGTVYVGSYDHYYRAFNQDGTQKWHCRLENATSSPAIGPDGTIYVTSDSFLYALNPDCTPKWRYVIHGSVRCCPAVGPKGTVYVGSYRGGGVYAIGPNGSLKWLGSNSSPAAGYSPAIGKDGTVYMGAGASLCALDPGGSLKWQYATDDWIESSPAIDSDGTVYVGSDDCFVYALNPDGTLKWRYETEGCVQTSPAIGRDGTIYVATGDGFLCALSRAGDLRWRCDIGVFVSASPTVCADGTIYIGSDHHGLYALSPSGTIKWDVPLVNLEGTPAVGSDGTVYFVAQPNFYAVQGSAPLADSPWPRHNHDNRNSGRVGGP